MQSNIQKWGNSQAIRLPKSIMETAMFKENEQVEIFAEKDRIIISKSRPHKTLDERFAGYEGESTANEYDWGKPMGKEVW